MSMSLETTTAVDKQLRLKNDLNSGLHSSHEKKKQMTQVPSTDLEEDWIKFIFQLNKDEDFWYDVIS